MKDEKKKDDEIFCRHGQVIFMKNEPGYGRIEVREAIENHELARLLLVDDVRESATIMEEGRHYELMFKYTKDFDIALQRRPEIKDTLLLGGAGFSFAKFYIDKYKDKHLDVVEFKAEMYQLAMQYFYLDELYRDYNLTETKRMEVFIEDANEYLAKTDRKYDLIINDCYIANRIDDDLLRDQQVQSVKRCLNPGGVYMINLITAVKGPASMPGILEYEILKNNFKNADMFVCKKEMSKLEKQNMILVGTDGEWTPVQR
ncbi:MAG: fused MFS/spermidine synthase [Eubacterium sp.]|nr:fused MFS/spermidine synthase [Eubacterium sp.]